ncbi:MAG: signal peptidase I, partial [Akkermansiaceae bacterium]|nr:signal peptidase I [Akkermansiaceae bacterium]
PAPLKQLRWPGVLLSLLVPGFGLFRAGLHGRAAAWFCGLQAASLVAASCLGQSMIPIVVAGVVCVVSILGQVGMLVDSFRPGRMTWRGWLLFAACVLALGFLPSPTSLVIHAFRIPAGSMEPTLLGSRSAKTPDHVIVDRLSYRFSKPERGDLIVFYVSRIPALRKTPGMTDENTYFVKRLVGLPGERIRFADGRVFADGRPLGEADGIPLSIRYVEPEGLPSSVRREGADFLIGPNEYFVLGDNTGNSYDSRYWGCVPASEIHGKATLIYYPFGRVGRLSLPIDGPERSLESK